MFRFIGLTVLLIAGTLIAGFVAWLELPTNWPSSVAVTSPDSRVRHYYLALGDSLAFGFQPNLQWSQGYAMQWWPELQRHGSKDFANYACMDESTETFIRGGCTYSKFRHDYYDGSQLDAAVRFLDEHKGDVGPVSLSIGWSDVQQAIHPNRCSVDRTAWNSDLSHMDENLVSRILPLLLSRLTDGTNSKSSNLILVGYPDPYIGSCPQLHQYIAQLNFHLSSDARRLGVQFVSVSAAFDKRVSKRNQCDYFWTCGTLRSNVPNSAGYKLMMDQLKRATGY